MYNENTCFFLKEMFCFIFISYILHIKELFLFLIYLKRKIFKSYLQFFTKVRF